jgi:hypothetical protein
MTLLEVQRRMAHAIMQPLTGSDESANARLQGVITDTTGAIVPGATIKVTKVDTNSVQTCNSGNGACEVRVECRRSW